MAKTKLRLTKVLLQAGQDVVILGCSSLSASVVGRTSIAGLLFVIFYFYNFIHQRLGADTAMNSLPDSNTRPLAASWFQTLDAKVLFKNKSCLVQCFQARCRCFFLRHCKQDFNRAGCKQFLF